MKKIIRAQYRAAILDGIQLPQIEDALTACDFIFKAKKMAGQIYTAGLFCYKQMLFLYVELILEDGMDYFDPMHPPAGLVTPLDPYLKKWPGIDNDACWKYMIPVFWFDVPKSYDDFIRKESPEKRCGRIAVLHPCKAMSYVCHHQAIAEEGLLRGDRYQFISIHENILFSYFETPRDREIVNIRRQDKKSEEIVKWNSVDPGSHFVRFLEAPNDNFMIIDTLIAV